VLRAGCNGRCEEAAWLIASCPTPLCQNRPGEEGKDPMPRLLRSSALTSVSRPEGGFVLWIQLPERYDGHDVRRRAAAIGNNIRPGAVFSASVQYANCVRIACTHPVETLQPAIRAVADLL
jgi:DNA-binding transcriptional MocR family regulator